MSISAIKQACTDYYYELPDAVLPTVAKSGFYTFAVAVFFSASTADGKIDIALPIVKAGVASLASAIHAVATPLFNRIFGTAFLNPVHELAKSAFVAFAASTIAGFSLNSTLQLTSFKLYYLISLNSVQAWMKQGASTFIKENSIYFCF